MYRVSRLHEPVFFLFLTLCPPRQRALASRNAFTPTEEEKYVDFGISVILLDLATVFSLKSDVLS